MSTSGASDGEVVGENRRQDREGFSRPQPSFRLAAFRLSRLSLHHLQRQGILVPYRTTPKPIEERRWELDRIVESEGVASFKTSDPHGMAYRLREALHAAKALSIEPYASLNVRIGVYSGDQLRGVFVVPKRDMSVEFLPTKPTKRTVDDALSAFDVVVAARKEEPGVALLFPHVPESELPPVEKWCAANGRVAEMVNGVLTITKES